jgi:hypothetical protein
MKCDELEKFDATSNADLSAGYDHRYAYDADEVDEAIAELKQKLDRAIAERDGNQVCIDALKQKLESVQASMYADVVDANMENRRLRRALWIARAEWARSSALSYHLIESHPDKDVSATYKRKANKWEKAKDKCLKKAEEYK